GRFPVRGRDRCLLLCFNILARDEGARVRDDGCVPDDERAGLQLEPRLVQRERQPHARHTRRQGMDQYDDDLRAEADPSVHCGRREVLFREYDHGARHQHHGPPELLVHDHPPETLRAQHVDDRAVERPRDVHGFHDGHCGPGRDLRDAAGPDENVSEHRRHREGEGRRPGREVQRCERHLPESPVVRRGQYLVDVQGTLGRFDGSGSTDLAYVGKNGVILDSGYAWDFNGDRATDATGRIVTWTLRKPGNFTINLTVTDSVGWKSVNATMTAIVNDTKGPVPAFDVLDPEKDWGVITSPFERKTIALNASRTTDN